jgi:uncharacterized membrane protein YdcZ (DUF606 family)
MIVFDGWFCLVGGVLGAVRVATAKKFFKSDFANSEGGIDKDDYTTEVAVTPVKRWIIVGICLAVAAFVIYRIYCGVATQN